MLRRLLSFIAMLSVLCCLGVAHADQSKGSRGSADGGQRGPDGVSRGDPGRAGPDPAQSRRDVLREAVKSQEDDSAVPLRQLSVQDKALLRQQLRQQRLDASR
jgi:hypothetical protein